MVIYSHIYHSHIYSIMVMYVIFVCVSVCGICLHMLFSANAH